jgi:hypothetical protein
MPRAKVKRNPQVLLPPSQRLAVVRPVRQPPSDMQLLTEAARDPRIDPLKMRELKTILNEERERAALTAWAEAMSQAQSRMEPVRKNCTNPSTHSKYASFAALDNAVRKFYSDAGLSLTYDTDPALSNDKRLMMICDVSKGSYSRRYHFPVAIVTKGPQGKDVMTETHAIMSAKTYGRRALLGMIFNIAELTDDDGNLASGMEAISAEQLIELEKLIEQTGADLDKFCAYLRIAELPVLPALRFKEAKEALQAIAKKKAERT